MPPADSARTIAEAALGRDRGQRAAARAGTFPVHADRHWGTWLARERTVTAPLDFE
ncbi:hypothetical protein [Amycolatopsis minnesotensis]|uniref:Uncharacterized protein n=1 Tax=Amycolatopsis minnesotensis TaxID=337894 RepID=A0ABN2RFY9_9PSEU